MTSTYRLGLEAPVRAPARRMAPGPAGPSNALVRPNGDIVRESFLGGVGWGLGASLAAAVIALLTALFFGVL